MIETGTFASLSFPSAAPTEVAFFLEGVEFAGGGAVVVVEAGETGWEGRGEVADGGEDEGVAEAEGEAESKVEEGVADESGY